MEKLKSINTGDIKDDLSSPILPYKKISPAQKVLAIVILVGGALASSLLIQLKPSVKTHPVKQRTPFVNIQNATSKAMRIPVFTRGKVVPRTQIELVAQVEGMVTYVSPNFHSGGYFQDEELLVQIEPRHYQLELTKKQSAVASAKFFLADVVAKSKVARVGAKRNASAYARYIPQLKEAEAKLAAAEADFEMAKLKLSFTEIKAPFIGRIKAKKVSLNQHVKLGSIFADIYSLESAEIRLPITDKQLALIDLPKQYYEDIFLKITDNSISKNIENIKNNVVEESVAKESDKKTIQENINKRPNIVVRSNYGGKTISRSGSIVRVEGGLDENQLLYIVGEIKYPFSWYKKDTEKPPLEVGLFVEVEVEGKFYQRVFTLPRQALRNNNSVWLVDDNGRLKTQPVEYLYRGPNKVYIDKGINEGDKVITSALDYIVDGMKVRFDLNAASLATN